MIDKIVISGGSITASPWLTWSDFVEFVTKTRCYNLAQQGSGNEQIVSSIVQHQSLLGENTLVIVMLTNVDKFDWYVEDDVYFNLCKEKHLPVKISSRSGFWCTGSWFPGQKELFKENFYSLDYFLAKSVQQIILLEQIIRSKKAHLMILYDSPVWSTTEQELNQTIDQSIPSFFVHTQQNLPYFMSWYSFLDDRHKHLEKRSLIGYCASNNLPWFNHRFKGHPPSSSHLSYYKQIIVPELNQYFDIESEINDQNLENKVAECDEQWFG